MTEKLRGNVVAFLSPFWETLHHLKGFIQSASSKKEEPLFEHERGLQLNSQEELARLQLTNQLLTNEVEYLNRLLEDKDHLEWQLKEIQILSPSSSIESGIYQKYIQRLKKQVEFKAQALPAKVIFRPFDDWNSSLWVNVGEADNAFYQQKIIAKNSPVLVGQSIVGVIDYVGRHQSRIRLITDPGLNPSVRAFRGGEEDRWVQEQVDTVIRLLQRKKTITLGESDSQSILQFLSQAKSQLPSLKKTVYLAKGELQGSLHPRAGGHQQILKGTGFNYDFSDEEGEARDLRSGKLLRDLDSSALPILKVNDLLVTTGLDGVFPAGFKVAIVTKIDLLKEGDYFYDLEAQPTAGNLHELSLVFVIPPLGFDSESQSH